MPTQLLLVPLVLAPPRDQRTNGSRRQIKDLQAKYGESSPVIAALRLGGDAFRVGAPSRAAGNNNGGLLDFLGYNQG